MIHAAAVKHNTRTQFGDAHPDKMTKQSIKTSEINNHTLSSLLWFVTGG